MVIGFRASTARMPCRCAGVGIVENITSSQDCRKLSQSPKKNALFLTIGPPKAAPSWFRSRTGFTPVGGLHNPVAFSVVSR